ncbi:hypothetical protein ACKUSY_15930 [Myroides odoratus]
MLRDVTYKAALWISAVAYEADAILIDKGGTFDYGSINIKEGNIEQMVVRVLLE